MHFNVCRVALIYDKRKDNAVVSPFIFLLESATFMFAICSALSLQFKAHENSVSQNDLIVKPVANHCVARCIALSGCAHFKMLGYVTAAKLLFDITF